MNANTIIAFKGGTVRNQSPVLSLATATETAFKVNTDGSAATCILSVPLQTAIVGSFTPLAVGSNPSILGPAYGRIFGTPKGVNSPYFTSDYFDGRPFLVRVSGTGNAVAGVGQKVLVDLALGVSATVGADTILATTGAALDVAAGGAFDFAIEATLLWDSTTQIVGGYFSAQLNFANAGASQVTAQKILTNYGASVVAASGLSFIPFAKMATTDVATLQLTEFAIDEI